MYRVRSLLCAGALGALAIGAALVASAPPAEARVFVGVGLGFPPPPVYYPPPAVVYAPPPVTYVPAPPTVAPAPMAAPGPAASAGGECREYQTQTMIDGRPQPSHGTACRQADGSWQIVN